MNWISLLLLALGQIVSNPGLQEKAAEPLAHWLIGALPDNIEDDIASFLELIAGKVRAAH